jgi:type IV fimbrial biogenesis protein FimT
MLKRLGPRRHTSGFSLVELIVTLFIVSTLMALAAPNFSEWIQNSRIRTTSEALLAGLQLTKSEAVSRNARVRFQLTSTLDSDCVQSTSGRNWVVNLDPASDDDAVEGDCNAAPSDTTAPRILQTRTAAEGSDGVAVDADSATLVFNGLGRVVPAPTGDVVFDVTPADGTGCAADPDDPGPMTCLRITVSPAGQIRMCNPAAASDNPQACL